MNCLCRHGRGHLIGGLTDRLNYLPFLLSPLLDRAAQIKASAHDEFAFAQNLCFPAVRLAGGGVAVPEIPSTCLQLSGLRDFTSRLAQVSLLSALPAIARCRSFASGPRARARRNPADAVSVGVKIGSQGRPATGRSALCVSVRRQLPSLAPRRHR